MAILKQNRIDWSELHMSAEASQLPEDMLRYWSPAEKARVFFALLRELIELNHATSPIPLRTDTGETMGTLFPPNLFALQDEHLHLEPDQDDHRLQEMPPNVREELLRTFPPDFDPDDCMTEDEVQEVKAEVLEKVR